MAIIKWAARRYWLTAGSLTSAALDHPPADHPLRAAEQQKQQHPRLEVGGNRAAPPKPKQRQAIGAAAPGGPSPRWRNSHQKMRTPSSSTSRNSDAGIPGFPDKAGEDAFPCRAERRRAPAPRPPFDHRQESVNRVMPPIKIIAATRPATVNSQPATAGLASRGRVTGAVITAIS